MKINFFVYTSCGIYNLAEPSEAEAEQPVEKSERGEEPGQEERPQAEVQAAQPESETQQGWLLSYNNNVVNNVQTNFSIF